jgi:asparagine synthase (glutamine-hydrolysing)
VERLCRGSTPGFSWRGDEAALEVEASDLGGVEGGQVAHVIVAVDARIDNAGPLARELGVESSTLPELVARCYLRWGAAFPERLLGDFAILLWDGRDRRLLACRDPFGVKPLAYRVSNDEVWLASRINQLLDAHEGLLRLDERAVVGYLLWRSPSVDGTFFEGIHHVPPGSTVTFSPGGVDRRRFWVPANITSHHANSVTRKSQQEEYFREVRRLFIQAVGRCLASDRPVVTHVSGGLDSSSIAVAAGEVLRGGALQAPGIVGAAGLLPGLACDESPFIDAVERRIPFPIERWDASRLEDPGFATPIAEDPGGTASFNGGSSGDLAIAIRHGARVILSGMGGDELMSPAGIVQDAIAHGDLANAARNLWFFEGATPKARLGRLKYVLRASTPIWARRRLSGIRAQIPSWLENDFHAMAREVLSPFHEPLRFSSHVQAHKWFRVATPEFNRPLSMLQRHASDHGIEYRFPFLDKELVQFVLAIPYFAWPRPRPFERLHRWAMRDLLPQEVAGRYGKAEFTEAIGNEMRQRSVGVENLLAAATWASARYVDRTEIERLWRRILAASNDVGVRSWRALWASFTLENWMRRETWMRRS